MTSRIIILFRLFILQRGNKLISSVEIASKSLEIKPIYQRGINEFNRISLISSDFEPFLVIFKSHQR